MHHLDAGLGESVFNGGRVIGGHILAFEAGAEQFVAVDGRIGLFSQLGEAFIEKALGRDEVGDVIAAPEAGGGRGPVEIDQWNVFVGVLPVLEHLFVWDEGGIFPAGVLLGHGLVAFDHDAEIRVRVVLTALDARDEVLERHRPGGIAKLLEVGGENPHLAGVLQVINGRIADLVVGLNPPEGPYFRNIDGLIGGQVPDGAHRGVDEDLQGAQHFAAHVSGEHHVLDDGELFLECSLGESVLAFAFRNFFLGRDIGPHQLVSLGVEPG